MASGTSPANNRRGRQRADARRSILDAAEALLSEDGPEGLSMRRVAERCGYTVPTLYNHFGDKPGLVDALLEVFFGRLLDEVRRVPQTEDPLENARRLARTFVAFGLRNPIQYRLLMAPRPADRPPPRSAERAREVLQRPLRELAQRRLLRGCDWELATQMLWVVTHGLISLPASRPDRVWAPNLIDATVRSVLAGLVRAPGEDAGFGEDPT